MVGILKRILKIESGVSLWQALADHFTDHILEWVMSLSGGALMAYLSALSAWVNAWGPIGWGAIGILSFLILMLGISIGSYLRAGADSKRALAKFTESTLKTASVNVLLDNFASQRINLSDFYHPFFKSIKYAKFTKCEIFGPAMMLPTQCTFDKILFQDCDVVIVNIPATAHTLTRFESCTFDQCSFYRITLFVSRDQAIEMQTAFPAINIVAGSVDNGPSVKRSSPSGL